MMTYNAFRTSFQSFVPLLLLISITCINCMFLGAPSIEFKTKLNAHYTSPRGANQVNQLDSQLTQRHSSQSRLTITNLLREQLLKLVNRLTGIKNTLQTITNQKMELEHQRRRFKRQFDPSVPMNVIKGITQGTAADNLGKTFQAMIQNLARITTQIRTIGSRIGERIG